MTRLRRCIALLFCATLGLWPGAAAGYGYQTLENPWNICAAQTQKQERAERIPHRLLGAIALAETGRWRPETGEIFAWPWTVMAEGEGRFFETKKTAVAWVKQLQTRGVENIDVGCMQVNLYYHGHQFASLEHAFDPDLNTAYAAKFLKEKYRATRSWLMAAGHYHSSDGDKNKPYRDKVRRFWTGTPVQAAALDSGGETGAISPKTARYTAVQQISGIRPARAPLTPIDPKRTAALNASFQKRTGANMTTDMIANTGTPAKAPSLRTQGPPRTAQGLQNRGRTVSFADRRQAQLEYWRHSRTWRNERAALR